MSLRALVIDDEAVARRRIRRLLSAEPDIEVIGEAADGRAALAAIAEGRPDLVFLDVQMPELDGLEVLQRVPARAMPAIVFVTAFDRYALQAFDLHAIDYLLKPFTSDRFRTALQRARQRILQQGHAAELRAFARVLRESPRYLARVAVPTRGRVEMIELKAVDWIVAAGNYVELHAAGREYLLRETMANLEQQLDPDRFARIHRSVIVQVDRIASLRPATHGDWDVLLRDGTSLTLSRTWRERVLQEIRKAGRP